MKSNYSFLIIVLTTTITLISCQKNHCIKPGDSLSEFEKMEWLNYNEITIHKLKGKVVLIRWWTDQCEYCINSADALNEWYALYHNQGLEVIGIYHVKPIDRKVDLEDVREYAREKRFWFPIGIDKDWKNLNKYWFNCGPKEFTSFSILLDKTGKIRYIHNGGEYQKQNQYEEQNEEKEELEHERKRSYLDFQEIDSLIQTVLKE